MRNLLCCLLCITILGSVVGAESKDSTIQSNSVISSVDNSEHTSELESNNVEDEKNVDNAHDVSTSSSNNELDKSDKSVNNINNSQLETVADEESQEMVISIDTMDLGEPQGNWFFKRYWYNKANKIYERINKLVDEVFEERPRFMAKRSELEHDLLDPFYVEIGMKQGELRGIVSFLVEHIKQGVEESGLSEKELFLLNKLKDHKSTVIQLYNDVEDISQIDRAIDQAIETLMEQLTLARHYKQEAWNYFKSIERELNDQKAREFVFAMRTMEKNIKDILTYLTYSFSNFFAHLSKSAAGEVDRVRLAIAQLKEKGIDLQEEAERLEFLDRPSIQKETEELASNGGFLEKIKKGVKAFFSSIWNSIAQ